MEYLAHNASFQLTVNNAPSKPGIKHLVVALSYSSALSGSGYFNDGNLTHLSKWPIFSFRMPEVVE
jgi:hypothetical protein